MKSDLASQNQALLAELTNVRGRTLLFSGVLCGCVTPSVLADHEAAANIAEHVQAAVSSAD